MRSNRSIVAVCLALATGLLGGCQRVSEPTPGTGSARQLVTAEFGATRLSDTPIPAGGSVLDALRATVDVETAHGGGFVSAIGDRRSDLAGQRDWFYYLNGVSARRGADQQDVNPGDVVWWDYHFWGGLADAGIVVGAWPEPFVNGYLERPASVTADPPLAAALTAAGATVTDATSAWRVRVDTDAALRTRDPAWRRAMADPVAAGLTVRIRDGSIEVLAPDGERFVGVPDGRALAATVPTGATPEAGGALLAVAGLDRAAADAAAARIAREPAVLNGRYAVVFDAIGQPIAAGGRPTL